MPQEPSPQQIADQKIYRQMGLIPSEYYRIVELLGRQPNYTETGIFAVMWSEHCSYKNSKPLLKLFPTEGSQVLQGLFSQVLDFMVFSQLNQFNMVFG